MISRLLPCIFTSASMIAMAADPVALNGKWHLQQSVSGHDSEQTCTFTQTGGDLSGTCSSDRGAVQISGKVADGKATWIYKSEYEGTPLTITYTAKLDSTTRIQGTMDVQPYAVSGEFTATPVK